MYQVANRCSLLFPLRPFHSSLHSASQKHAWTPSPPNLCPGGGGLKPPPPSLKVPYSQVSFPQVGVMCAFHSTQVSERVLSSKPGSWLQRALEKRRALGRDWGTCRGCKGWKPGLEAELPGTAPSAAQLSWSVEETSFATKGP